MAEEDEAEDIALWEAIQCGDLDAVKSLLAQEWPDVPDVNATNDQGETALTLCVVNASDAKNSLSILKALLAAEGADVNKPNAQGCTPLMLAAQKAQATDGYKGMAKYALARQRMRVVTALLEAEGIDLEGGGAGEDDEGWRALIKSTLESPDRADHALPTTPLVHAPAAARAEKDITLVDVDDVDFNASCAAPATRTTPPGARRKGRVERGSYDSPITDFRAEQEAAAASAAIAEA